jgi:hypothetical protein
MGEGPLTGGGFGYCGGAAHSRQFLPGRFGNWQGGFGRGGGWRYRNWATGRPGWSRFRAWGERPWSADDERQALERDADALKMELKRIRARIEELGRAPSE